MIGASFIPFETQGGHLGSMLTCHSQVSGLAMKTLGIRVNSPGSCQLQGQGESGGTMSMDPVAPGNPVSIWGLVIGWASPVPYLALVAIHGRNFWGFHIQ